VKEARNLSQISNRKSISRNTTHSHGHQTSWKWIAIFNWSTF